MIGCVRIWTGPDGNSRFEAGAIDLGRGERGDLLARSLVHFSIGEDRMPSAVYRAHGVVKSSPGLRPGC